MNQSIKDLSSELQDELLIRCKLNIPYNEVAEWLNARTGHCYGTGEIFAWKARRVKDDARRHARRIIDRYQFSRKPLTREDVCQEINRRYSYGVGDDWKRLRNAVLALACDEVEELLQNHLDVTDAIRLAASQYREIALTSGGRCAPLSIPSLWRAWQRWKDLYPKAPDVFQVKSSPGRPRTVREAAE